MAVESPWPLLRKRFPAGEYALLAEVRDAAGFGSSRAADGIAMNLWPSRGLEVEGIEIKSYRSDWLKELKTPEKAENIFRYCDRWWLVAAAEDVVKVEEVPKTWGLMVVVKGRLKTIKDAPKLTPIGLDRNFVAAMLKRATKGMIPAESIADQVADAREQGKADGKNDSSYQHDRRKEELASLSKRVSDFEDISGVKINDYQSPKKIGDAVRFILDGGTELIEQKLIQLKQTSDFIANHIKTGLVSVSKPEEALTEE